MPFLGPNWPICHKQNFNGTNHYYYFHLPTGPFHCAKFKKNSYSESRGTRIHHFWAPNGSFAPIFFFFLKKIISFSSTYWPLSFCEILKKFLKPIQIYEDVLFSDPKYPNLSWTKFLVQTIIITFIYLLALFIGQNLKKKNSCSRSRVMRMHHFWTQNSPFAPNKIFFGKLLIPLSSTC